MINLEEQELPCERTELVAEAMEQNEPSDKLEEIQRTYFNIFAAWLLDNYTIERK